MKTPFRSLNLLLIAFLLLPLSVYAASGDLDLNFGSAGKIVAETGNADSYGSAVAMQTEDYIIVAGHVLTSADNHDFAVKRYYATGVTAGDLDDS